MNLMETRWRLVLPPRIWAIIWLLAAALLAACAPPAQAPTATPPASATPAASSATATATPAATPTLDRPLRLAVIGDFGEAGPDAAAVAALIESWAVDFIVTTGDNNYPAGAADTIDENIGQYYHSYIGDYVGDYPPGAPSNRFFPSLGNHDWDASSAAPYLEYFNLPGNERYYDVVWPPLHLFVLDSDPREPDGVGRSSAQAAWLEATLITSRAPWQVVVMHHPPYSSSYHGSTDWMQWPFAEWGADLVLAGHDHVYERLAVEGLPYITNGLGGSTARYRFYATLAESQVRYNAEHGALFIEASEDWLRIDFINTDGELIDSVTLSGD